MLKICGAIDDVGITAQIKDDLESTIKEGRFTNKSE